ncbi:SFCGS family glycine-rich protein [Klebsiella pneumoniae]
MEQITVVIGDRLGKGQKVAAGAEKAGARAVVVPGVAADMKLGDIMKAENATFGISFCGSGGADACLLYTSDAAAEGAKYGYKAKYGMRSIDEGVTAINEGCNVLGFGFMDKEELGERLVEAWKKKYGA